MTKQKGESNIPYIKKAEEPFAGFGRLLKGYGLNGHTLAVALDCAPATALKKLANPGLFTLTDLANINGKCHISMDEIRAAIVR